MRATAKQVEQMRVITQAGDRGIDLDEIVDQVRYETTKQSLQFSIRALIKHGMVEKKGPEVRRGRERQIIRATALGIKSFGSGKKHTPAPSYVVSEEDEVIEFLE